MKNNTQWLQLRNLPLKNEFETICAPLSGAGKVTLGNFPKSKAALFSNFSDGNTKAYILNTGKMLYILMESDFDPLAKLCFQDVMNGINKWEAAATKGEVQI